MDDRRAPDSSRSNGPPSGRLRQALKHQNREAYRDAILDAAEQLCTRGSCQEAKMTDIAEIVGVSVGTLYNYFSSKDDVFESLFERGRRQFFEWVESPVSTEDPLDNLRVTLDRTFGFIEEHGPGFTHYLRLGAHEVSETSHFEKLGGQQDRTRYTAHLEALLREGVEAGLVRADVDPAVLAAGLYSLMNGLVFAWVNSAQSGLVRNVPLLLKLFFEGAGAQ
jgi:TetR/AcrR family acrAB operon transcriptional repressor